MAWSYLSNIFSFSRYGRDDSLGHPSSKSDTQPPPASRPSSTNSSIEAIPPRQFDTEPSPASPPLITSSTTEHILSRQPDSEVPNDIAQVPNESPKSSFAELPPIADSSAQVALSRQSDTEWSSAPLALITGSSVEYVLARQFDESEVPNDIGEAPNESSESDLVDSASEIPDAIVEALDKSSESHLAGSQPASQPVIANSSVAAVLLKRSDSEVPNKSPESDLVNSASAMPDTIVEALDKSPESHLAESPPASQPFVANSSIEAVQSYSEVPNESPESDHPDSPPASPTPITIYDSPESNLNISQVSLMIRSAREPGNKITFKQVKNLFKKAARTARKKLTPAQIYIVDNWDSHSARSRRSSTFSLHSTLYPPLQLAQASSVSLSFPKIFVDASFYGIGFIFNDRWLAWTFTQNHTDYLLGSDGNIDMSWAELIAVELGILTLLSSGYRNMKVLVRSDNKGVVNALGAGAWTPNHGLDIILARIVHLCKEARLELEPDWISSGENPADGPSRGEYPPLDLMLDHSPRIPPHLEGLVIPVGAAGASLRRT